MHALQGYQLVKLVLNVFAYCYCPGYYIPCLCLQNPMQYRYQRICPILTPCNCCHWDHLCQKTLTQVQSHYIPLVLVSFCKGKKKTYFSTRREWCISKMTRQCCVFEHTFGCSCCWSQIRFILSLSSFESVKIELCFFKGTAEWHWSRCWRKL